MKHGEISLYQRSGDYIGKVNVSLKFDIPEEMMRMMLKDIEEGLNHWQNRIILTSHNDGKRET